jgi:hypothetical protein
MPWPERTQNEFSKKKKKKGPRGDFNAGRVRVLVQRRHAIKNLTKATVIEEPLFPVVPLPSSQQKDAYREVALYGHQELRTLSETRLKEPEI